MRLFPGRTEESMKIEAIEIRELRLDLIQSFETSFARVNDQNFLLLKTWVDGVAGWSECVADRAPDYSYETVRTAWHLIEDFIAPIVFSHDYSHPDEILPSLAPIRGHNMAKAAVEMGFWDAYARHEGKPLSKVLGGVRTEIASGVSIGIQESIDELLDKIAKELADGYRRIKIKIKPGGTRRWSLGCGSDFPTRRSWWTQTPPTVSKTSHYSKSSTPST